jgi:hypothetical protein
MPPRPRRSDAAGRLEAGLAWPASLAQALPSRMAGAACTIAAFGRGRPYMAWPRAVSCADEAFALRLDWPARFEQNCCPASGAAIPPACFPRGVAGRLEALLLP